MGTACVVDTQHPAEICILPDGEIKRDAKQLRINAVGREEVTDPSVPPTGGKKVISHTAAAIDSCHCKVTPFMAGVKAENGK